MQSVGTRIRTLRKVHGYTQKDMAKYLQTSQSYIAKLENDRLQLNDEVMNKLCLLYNCNEDYISEGMDDKIIKFRSNVRNLDLNTIVRMNKIIKNLEYLSKITQDLN